MDPDIKFSIVIPACNEQQGLEHLIPELRSSYPDAEIIVVDDGSHDSPRQLCAQYNVNMIKHLQNMGNGAAIKSGARAAKNDIIIFMDADGQHQAADIASLLTALQDGVDMVVGYRTTKGQASTFRSIANWFYNRMASLMVGHNIPDLTSGFRAVRTDLFCEFIPLLPNGFSYPTTITMAFFRTGYQVTYVPISVMKREGKSHIRPLRDGIRFLLIIFKIGTLYSPLKLFVPISGVFFLLGLFHYLYTFATEHRFTNMSALLFITAVLVFLIGLVSEQITTLMYTGNRNRD